ncbi:hypothetical protein L1887_20967 [Cichorium endivia]|nr:hypothetical protein L1887_20967 [Cichorium endivia]
MAKPTTSELLLRPTIAVARSTTSPPTSEWIDCCSSLYVGDLEENVNESQLFDLFNGVGQVHSVRVCRDQENGASLGYGYVNFTSSEEANSALRLLNFERLNGKQIRIMFFDPDPTLRRSEPKAAADAIEGLKKDGIIWYARMAQKKTERQIELKGNFDEDRNFQYKQLKEANLYMKNLDETITDDDKLKALFSEYGTITSCKVMVDSRGVSKGFGFVAFSTQEEAKKAMAEMNRKMVGRKPLYVSVAERKDERSARLQAQFAQARASPCRIGVHQGASGLLSPPGYGSTQYPLMAGVRPSNFMAPIRTGSPQDMLHQLMPDGHNQGIIYVWNGSNLMDHPIDQVLMGNNMFWSPFDVSPAITSSHTDFHISGPLEPGRLASVLASASPENQRLILGEYLYPLVKQFEHENATRVTGLLLEMDEAEVLHLIESPDELKKKVGEAMEVLVSESPCVTNVGDPFGSLSLGRVDL